MKIEDLKNANHSYYCNDNNYYSNDSVFTFDTFADFLDEMGSADGRFATDTRLGVFIQVAPTEISSVQIEV